MSAIVLRLPLVYGRNAKGNFARLVQAVVSRSPPAARLGPQSPQPALRRQSGRSDRRRRSLRQRSPSGVHFVADAEAVSTPDLVRAIAVAWRVKARLFAVPVPILRVAGLAAGRSVVVARLTDSLEVDTSSFREATRWSPRWSLDAALSRTASQHRGCAAVLVAAIIVRFAHFKADHVASSERAPPDQLRPLRITRNFTRHAEGSVLIEIGDTQVLCTASVEDGVPAFLKGSGEGWLTAEYGMLPRSTHTRDAARGRRRQAVGTHAGDPAPDRPQPARGHRSCRARRAHDPDRLRRAAGRRRHALRVDHRRVRRARRRDRAGAASAASSPASRCAISSPRCRSASSTACRCSTSTTPRTRPATPT